MTDKEQKNKGNIMRLIDKASLGTGKGGNVFGGDGDTNKFNGVDMSTPLKIGKPEKPAKRGRRAG